MSRFKPGQEVVSLVDINYGMLSRPLVKGRIYTVKSTICCCRQHVVCVEEILFSLREDDDMQCAICDKEIKTGDIVPWPEKYFAPLDELEGTADEFMREVKRLLETVEEPEKLVLA